ncbi:uncharacterized protein SPSC_02832 [Sporisorium scitamineum]|uniref:Uncharacterized protein n=2 Tax=Sporisorium scitamineum TaxID=49012 RepID=A0A127ZFF7_9BASI|nr:uncharacterized protein SPSC_02832 [Sporisorium scitamineum]
MSGKVMTPAVGSPGHLNLTHNHRQQRQQQQQQQQGPSATGLSAVTIALLSISSDKENIFNQPCHNPKPSIPSPVQRQRSVLSDITPTVVNTPTPSALALLHARTNRTIIAADATLRKSVLGHQHRRKTIKRRNAISLTKDQAMQIAGSLTCLSTDTVASEEGGMEQQREQTQEGELEDVEMRTEARGLTVREGSHNDAGRRGIGSFRTIALQSNLFLITRTDGHAFTCPLLPASKV